MKKLIVREARSGRTAKINAMTTYQTESGEWVAEVDGIEFRKACSLLTKGISGIKCENLHVQTAEDDDGKEYRVLQR